MTRSIVPGIVFSLGVAVLAGCGQPQRQAEPQTGPARRAEAVAAARLAQDSPTDPEGAAHAVSGLPAAPPAQPTGPDDTEPLRAASEIAGQIPDPTRLADSLQGELDRELGIVDNRPLEAEEKDRLKQAIQAEYDRRLRSMLDKTAVIHRPTQVEITLTDAIRRALANSYLLQVEAYNPAIESTRIVEAEAQFDAVYFANFNYDRQDRPTASQLQSSQTDARNFQTGIRKLLSTGMQVQVSYGVSRTWTNLVFATMNPSYFDTFTVEFRQPFLRGFGLDFNRAQIELAKLDRHISLERLRREVRETLHNVEQSYWQLLQARRRIAVSARLLTDLETILDRLEQRKAAGYDVYGVQLALTRSRIEQRRADYIRRINDVGNAEDALKALLNDPTLNLAEDIEIIPVDSLSLEPIVLDELGEVAAGLTHRAELHEARLTIEKTQLGVGVAKNQVLPRLDLLFRYVVDGMGDDWDGSFSQLSMNDFHEYVVGLEFEWPIGNRGPEAALRRARLQQAQAIAGHRLQIENVIREIKAAIRDLKTSYTQVGPALRVARASRDQLEATKARQEKLDPPSLQIELDAHETLAGARDGLLQTLVGYNVSLSNLERRKGTLLEYNNVIIRGVDDERYQHAYQPAAVPSAPPTAEAENSETATEPAP